LEFAHGPVSGAPAEATVGVDVDFLGRRVAQDSAQALGDIVGGFGMERLDVDDARPQLTAIVPFFPLLDLGHLAAGIFEYELVCTRFQDTREIVTVAALEAGAPKAIAEADVEGQLRIHPFCR